MHTEWTNKQLQIDMIAWIPDEQNPWWINWNHRQCVCLKAYFSR